MMPLNLKSKFALIKLISLLSILVFCASFVKSKKYKITMVSGVYAQGKFLNAEVTHHSKGNPSQLSKKGAIAVMLKDSKNNTLFQSHFPTSFTMELLKKGGGEHVKAEDVAPIVVAFPYTPKAKKVVIKKGNKILFIKKL